MNEINESRNIALFGIVLLSLLTSFVGFFVFDENMLMVALIGTIALCGIKDE